MSDDLAAAVERLEAELRQLREERLQDRAEIDRLRQGAEGAADVLRTIACSPNDVQRVLDAIVETAVRLCDASGSAIVRVRPRDGRLAMCAAAGRYALSTRERFGPDFFDHVPGRRIGDRTVASRAFLEQRTVAVVDMLDAVETEYPDNRDARARLGTRSQVALPLIDRGHSVGVLNVSRHDVRPFTQHEIALLETFADQAVIAIENARLFSELERRNTELSERTAELHDRTDQLATALEQQTALADVLRVIASAPSQLDVVLQAILETAARLCDAEHGVLQQRRASDERLVSRAHYGAFAEVVAKMQADGTLLPFDQRFGISIPRESVGGRALLEHRAITVEDMMSAPDYPEAGGGPRRLGFVLGSQVSVALLHHGEPLGVISLCRTAVRPFTDRQVALLEAFADQAAIAIENARLFSELEERNAELRETLQQQAATAEALRIVASSPTSLTTVLTSIAETATRLAESDVTVIHRETDGGLHIAAWAGAGRPGLTEIVQTLTFPIDEHSVAGRAALERRVIHQVDVRDIEGYSLTEQAQRLGYRSVLAVPLLREGRLIGVIASIRYEARAFSDRQIALLETFADQAVIAIENARLFEALEQRTAELSQALEQQTALGEVLRIIASSPTDPGRALQAVAEGAQRLCGGATAWINQLVGDQLRCVAMTDTSASESYVGYSRPLVPTSAVGRAILTRSVVHTEDSHSQAFRAEYPDVRRGWNRSTIWLPLVREGVAIGALVVGRTEVRPFTEQQIALLETFATQAVIAIENARLFAELQQRNEELEESNRRVSEALEQQTATAEVLRVIASAPTDLQRVLDAIVETAARLCGAGEALLYRSDGDLLRASAAYGPASLALRSGRMASVPIDRGWVAGRVAADRVTVHISDMKATSAADFPVTWTISDEIGWPFRSFLGAPLQRDGSVIGVIQVYRPTPRPFSDQQVALLQTFADQAVIAIENARLFAELEERNRRVSEALEQQTALAEVLRVIAASPTDVQRVLDTIVETAARLCDAPGATLYRPRKRDGRMAASAAGGVALERAQQMFGSSTTDDFFELDPGIELSHESMAGRAFLTGRTLAFSDDVDSMSDLYPASLESKARYGYRSIACVPLLQQGQALGLLNLVRYDEARPFTEQQIALLETFADQAVIAIENARLFAELQQRTAELTEALEQQTALADVLRVIASSPTDAQRVLDAIVETAARLCDASGASILQPREGHLAWRAASGALADSLRRELGENYLEVAPDIELSRQSTTGRAFLDRRTVVADDVAEAALDEYPASREWQARLGQRSGAAIPLMQHGESIGVLAVVRFEVRPFTERQIALLETFADQAVIAIENARLFSELQERTAQLGRSVEELQALGAVGQAVSSSLDLQQVLTTIVTHAVQLPGTDGGVIYEYDEEADDLHAQATLLFDRELADVLQAAHLRLGEGAVGRAIATRAPVQVADLLVEGAYTSQVRDALVRSGHRALLAVPVLREGRVLGSLGLARRSAGEFSSEVVALVQTFAAQSALAIENARLFQDLEAQGRALEVASQHKSQFLANMSHELRTPLNAIIGYSEMLQEEAEDLGEATLIPDLQRVNAAGRHLLGLINDILDLSKIEAGRMDLLLEDFEVGGLVRDVEAIVQPLMEKNGNVLIVSCPSDIGSMHADLTKVRQTLFNLLSNAAKFTEGGTITLRVARSQESGVRRGTPPMLPHHPSPITHHPSPSPSRTPASG